MPGSTTWHRATAPDIHEAAMLRNYNDNVSISLANDMGSNAMLF